MTDQAFEKLDGPDHADWVVICDHARNTVPSDIAGGDLGIDGADMARHIAYDIGAEGVTRALAKALHAPAVVSNFSRLVIDPNRGEDDPTLLMRLYDGTIIPANRAADRSEKERRLASYHRPYHRAVGEVMAAHPEAILVSIHSFTPQLRGRAMRPWHVGVLYSHDRRLADPLMDVLNAIPELCIGDNEPYGGHLPGDTIDRHGICTGRPHILIEVRNDLIATAPEQEAWGLKLADILRRARVQM